MPLLAIHSLNRSFGNDTNYVHVLKDIHLEIDRGEFIAIMGQSGSGKSTLMNILGCLDTANSGSYKIDGQETAKMNSEQLSALRRKKFGFIFQRYNLLSALSANENVMLPAVYLGVPKDKRNRQANMLLQNLELQGKEKNKPNELSGGQQQRVSIARALMNGGEIILADEPTGALDSQSGEMVMEILQDLHKQGHTIILVTHDANIANFAHRIIEIKDGEIISDKQKKKKAKSGYVSNPAKGEEKFSWALWRDQFLESFSMSVQAILSHKLRSLLTMLGIIIGIASVISVVALGKGSQEKILEDISSMGTNTISIFPGSGFGDRRQKRVKTLTIQDVYALQSQSYVDSVSPSGRTGGTLTYLNNDLTAQLEAVGEGYFSVKGYEVSQGRLFNYKDVLNGNQVVVIDNNTQNKLFADGSNPIGKTILFSKRPLTIIGVMKKIESGPWGDSTDLFLWSPYTTVMQKISGEKNIDSAIVKIKNNVNSQVAEKNLTELLMVRHGKKDFFTENSDTIKQTIESTTSTMTLLVSSIAFISLVVGGIGVMNIMLVSVTERTKEIGIRMAVGARRFDILQQFLIEAVLICLSGGIIGIMFSYFISLLFNVFMKNFAMSFSWWSIVVAVLSSTFIGVIFGFMPARNASQLNPIEALARE